ncbi:MAG TPA: DUF6636 domain-containing protein [Actinomycetota bacterium]
MEPPTQPLPPQWPQSPPPPPPEANRRSRLVLAVVGGAAIGATLVAIVVILALRRNPTRQEVLPVFTPTAVTPTQPAPPSISPQPAPSQSSGSSSPAPQGRGPATFVMPSRNIGCAFQDVVLRCDILSGMNPTPPGACELDWTGITITEGGDAHPQCAGDTVLDPSAPVFSYGRSWTRGGITCQSRPAGLTCRNDLGHGFFLSRAHWNTF